MRLVVQPAPSSPTGLQQGAGGANSTRCCAFTRSLLILRSVSVIAEDFVFSELFCAMRPQQHPSLRSRVNTGSSLRSLPCKPHTSTGTESTEAVTVPRGEP